jgi:hypothetical protein
VGRPADHRDRLIDTGKRPAVIAAGRFALPVDYLKRARYVSLTQNAVVIEMWTVRALIGGIRQVASPHATG